MENTIHIKVEFPLIVDDGFPPISVEILNAQLKSNGKAVIDNTPFFVKNIASGNIIECERMYNSDNYRFLRTVHFSGDKALCVIFIKNERSEYIYQYLKNNGCYCEYGEFPEYNMLAISVKKDIDINTIVCFLQKEEDIGSISYSELCL